MNSLFDIGDAPESREQAAAPPTVYAYDAAGKLTGEYSTTAPSTTGTLYPTGDHLGSTRVVTSAANTLVNGVSPGAAGTVVKCYDYMPFGEDIPSGVGSRGSCYPSGQYPATPDVLSVKFTGKERDAESGLDNFIARYFSSPQGRFASPDEPLNDQNPADPQSWNLYSYVRNNPLINTDPSGQDCIYTGGYGSNGTVAVSNEQGSCSGVGGTYVAGTVDISSVNVNANNGTLNYGYTPYDPNGNYTFSNLQLPASVEFPGIEGPANQAGAAQIAGSQSVINQFAKMAALGAVGGIAGAGVEGLLAARAAGAAAAGAETVQFGRTANQVYHAFRYLQEAGVDVEAAKDAILRDIAGKGALPSGLTTGTVDVGGRSLTYNAFRLADGTINVGRITIK